jgi:hypothetical protein
MEFPPVPVKVELLDALRDNVDTVRSALPGVTVIDCVAAVSEPEPNDMV